MIGPVFPFLPAEFQWSPPGLAARRRRFLMPPPAEEEEGGEEDCPAGVEETGRRAGGGREESPSHDLQAQNTVCSYVTRGNIRKTECPASHHHGSPAESTLKTLLPPVINQL